jgi:hypothetical protein
MCVCVFTLFQCSIKKKTVFLLLQGFQNARFIFFFKFTFGNIDLPYNLQCQNLIKL